MPDLLRRDFENKILLLPVLSPPYGCSKGHKVTIFLEELQIPYRVRVLDLGAGDQFPLVLQKRVFQTKLSAGFA